jgi:hypothetical protein
MRGLEVARDALFPVYLLRTAYFIRSFDKNPVFMRVRRHLRVPVEPWCEAGITFFGCEQVKEGRTSVRRVRFCPPNAQLSGVFDVA